MHYILRFAASEIALDYCTYSVYNHTINLEESLATNNCTRFAFNVG